VANDIGERLKKAREGKAFTIDDVRKSTRIHSEVITALEDGRCGEILSSTYVKSFLKKYASFLGLDAEAIAKEYAVTHPEIARDNRIDTSPRKEAREPDLISNIIITAGIILVLTAFLFFAAFLGGKILSTFKRPRAQKANVSRRSNAKALPKLVAASSSMMGTSKSKEAAFKTSIPKTTPIYLVLKIKQSVLVKVKKDGVLLFERVLPRESVESFRATEKIELYLAKAEAVELVLNGQTLGSPGKGLIRNLEITRKGIRIR